MSLLRRFFGSNKIQGFVSEIDQFLQTFARNNPRKSRSQLQEISKFKRIFYLRDHAVKEEPSKKIWPDF